MPPAERPRLILAWFDVRDIAYRYGPDAPETRAAVRSLDNTIGKLKSAIDELRLPVDLVVVSDHGIAKPESSAWVALDSQADLTGFQAASNALIYGPSDADSERVYNKLKQASADFVAYRLKNAPSRFHLYGNVRFGDPVVIALKPIALLSRALIAPAGNVPPVWIDGLDAQAIPEMKGIFFATGPDIVEGKTVAPFENVNLYPWIAHLLNLSPPKNDGSLGILSGTLRDSGDDTANEGASDK
jgi:alkaline phosphatase D